MANLMRAITYFFTPWAVPGYRPHATDPELTVRVNLYDHHAWYFIKTGDGFGLRISEKPSVAAVHYRGIR